MATRSIERAALLLKRDLTLGTLFDRLEKVHGDRQLVTEADGRARPHLRAGGRRVRRWAGGIAAQTEPGDVVVVATANGYEQLLLCCAAARGRRDPGAGERPDAQGGGGARRGGQRGHARAAASPGVGRRRRLPHRRAQGRSPTTSPPSSTRRAPPASPRAPPSPTGRSWARWPTRSLWPARLHRDEAVIALPVAHIMGFAVLIGLGVAGIPAFLLPKFNPVKVLDAIESAPGDDVRRRARHVPDARRGPRRRARPHVGAGVGLGRRRHAARAGGAVQEDGRHHDRAAPRCGRPGRLRRGLRHGGGRGRRGRQALAAVPRRRVGALRARRSGSPCPATRCGWSTTTATSCPAARWASSR